MMMKLILSCLLTSVVAIREQTVQERTSLLAQTWDRALDDASPKANPVSRAVNLLKEMSVTLKKDMEEDEALYGKLSCWCKDNSAAKKKSIKSGTEKVAELEASIEGGTASSGNLKGKIKELDGEVADNKDTLAKATALRKKELSAFAASEKDAVANIANLKGAVVVLSKHHGAALPQLAVSFFQSESKKDQPWGLESQDQRDLDMFMSDNSFDSSNADTASVDMQSESRFLQKVNKVQNAPLKDGWSVNDVASVQSALRTASAFVQKRGQDASAYVPAYESQSGEIFGVLKQLQEDMEKDLSESQKTESKRAGDFADLRKAKTEEIDGGWKSSEQKEDELAKTDNDLADAKEDLGQTKTTLADDTKFAENLKSTCDEADANFAQRKASRLAEIKSVSDAVAILSDDEAKDAMEGTFNKKGANFLQLSSQKTTLRRRQAAKLLRRQAAKFNSPALALLATSAELDAFTKVKLVIDKMVATLSTQQADEVKKNDWCTSELQSNDMATLKSKDRSADLDAAAEERSVTIKTVTEEIAAAKKAINDAQVSLQQATVQRKKDNQDFQKTVADQMLTIKVLEKAMDRLATYYDNAALVQIHAMHKKQTPPVPQMKYKASAASGGVISLIEKLVYDAKEIMGESKKAESEAQAAYEELVADTNDSTKSLTKTVLTKTDVKVEAKKDLMQKNLDLKETGKELERLAATDGDLHKDCDYVLKNFGVRQQARSEEIESLKQAKSILSGASV